MFTFFAAIICCLCLRNTSTESSRRQQSINIVQYKIESHIYEKRKRKNKMKEHLCSAFILQIISKRSGMDHTDFLQAGCSCCHPTSSVKILKERFLAVHASKFSPIQWVTMALESLSNQRYTQNKHLLSRNSESYNLKLSWKNNFTASHIMINQ